MQAAARFAYRWTGEAIDASAGGAYDVRVLPVIN